MERRSVGGKRQTEDRSCQNEEQLRVLLGALCSNCRSTFYFKGASKKSLQVGRLGRSEQRGAWGRHLVLGFEVSHCCDLKLPGGNVKVSSDRSFLQQARIGKRCVAGTETVLLVFMLV